MMNLFFIFLLQNGANVVVCKNLIGFETVEAYFNEVFLHFDILFEFSPYFSQFEAKTNQKQADIGANKKKLSPNTEKLFTLFS